MPIVRYGVVGLNDVGGTLANLRYTLQLLAASGPEQINHFMPPDFAFKADELAVEFHHWANCVATYVTLTTQQAALLAVLDAFLDTAAGEDGEIFWTDQGVLTHPGWARARMMAKTVLDAFGWEATIPPREELVEDREVGGEE